MEDKLFAIDGVDNLTDEELVRIVRVGEFCLHCLVVLHSWQELIQPLRYGIGSLVNH